MSHRHASAALLLLTAVLAVDARAQTLEHPCDDRTRWPTKGKFDDRAIGSEEGLYFAAAFDFLTLQSDKVKSIPAVERFFNKLDVQPDRQNPREKADRADQECVVAPDQQFFVQCDAVLNRAYVGVSRIALSQGRWLAAAPKPGGRASEATLKQAREALTLVCDRFDSRRQAYAKRLRQDSDLSAGARISERRRTQAAASAPAPSYEEAAMIAPPALAPSVGSNDPRLQTNACRHLCEAYLAFGSDGCSAGMDPAMKRWCEQKYQAVTAANCVCR